MQPCVGAFGIVYKAIHNASKDVRAVKLIEKNRITAEKQSKLLQEISILKQLVVRLCAL